MLYVKDLGPTAHRVAKRKLQGSWTQPSSGSFGVNCRDSFQRDEYQTRAASFPHHQRECGSIPSTCPASQCFFDIRMACDISKQSEANYHEKETKHAHQVGDFDLNQDEASDVVVVNNCCKDGDLRTPSRSLGVAPATTAVSSISSQSTLNLLCMKSRLRESSSNDVGNRPSANGHKGVYRRVP